MKPAFLHLKYGPDGVVTADGDPSYYHGNAVTMSDGSRNGVYSEWDWDGTTLRAGNCRYGMSPLFYYCGDRELCISNSIPKMLELGVPSDWDDDAMAVFIRRHTFLGEDTPFKHIRATPPGAKLTWHNGRMSLESSRIEPKPQHLKRSAIVDGIIELFREAIARRLPDTEDFYLPLTGGKDSRHILLELIRQGVRPKACVTALKGPPRDGDDASIAAQLTERLGLRHIILPPSTSFVADERRKNLRTNFCTLDHGWSLPLVDFLEANTKLSYDGLGLDVFFETIWHSNERDRLYKQHNYESLASEILGDSEDVLSSNFGLETSKRFNRCTAVDRLIQELKIHADKPHPIATFQFWSRTRRTTSAFTFGLQYDMSNVHTPFLDTNLFDFIYSSNPDKNFRLHFDSISLSHPEYNKIPYTIPEPNQNQSSWYIRKSAFNIFSNLFKNLRKNNTLQPMLISRRLLRSTLTGKSVDLNWIQPNLISYMTQLTTHLNR